MKRSPVVSRSLLSVGYQNGVLEVEFRANRHVYQHTGVPEYIYKELMSAFSKGKYYIDHIKGRYSSTKVFGFN